MERMLGALNMTDSVYKLRYPSWVILDEDLKERIYRSFRMRSHRVLREKPVTVVTNRDAGEILEISVGSEVMGRRETRMNLSDSLHNEILAGNYARQVADPVPLTPPGRQLPSERPRLMSVSASAFGATVLLSNAWGAEVRLGHDEIGYHFWSTGSFRAMAIFDQLKVGIVAPLKYGRSHPDIVEPLSIRPRRLSGPKGFAAEFRQPFNAEALEARFSIGEITKLTNPELLTDVSRSYYIHTIAQLSYFRREMLDGGRHVFNLAGGAGFHQIALGETQTAGRIVAIEKHNVFSPVVRVEYIRNDMHMYGLGLQYYGSILFASGWVELIRNFFYLDLKYYAPVFRGPKPWEQSYFFMISPRIRVAY
jgi:hypothetical protein